jgi:hypothetical protein
MDWLCLDEGMPTMKKTEGKQAIYAGCAVAPGGRSLALKVYYLGGLDYELHCATRPAHVFNASATIGDDPITKEFVKAYQLDQVRLARLP